MVVLLQSSVLCHTGPTLIARCNIFDTRHWALTQTVLLLPLLLHTSTTDMRSLCMRTNTNQYSTIQLVIPVTAVLNRGSIKEHTYKRLTISELVFLSRRFAMIARRSSLVRGLSSALFCTTEKQRRSVIIGRMSEPVIVFTWHCIGDLSQLKDQELYL